MQRIGVLISGGGSNLQALIESMERNNVPAQISVVLSDKDDAYGLVRAREKGIPAYYINKKDFNDRDSFNHKILDKLKEHQVDFVVLAGYLSILSSKIVAHYKNKIINIHPSLIPAFCGMGYYGERVHQAVLEYGAKVTGATVHFVDEGADTGPIIMQKPVMVMPDDDVHTLAQRVLHIEHELLPKAVELLVGGNISVDGRRVHIRNG